MPQLFLDAMNGKFKNETRWISREEFFKHKDEDPFIRVCWSFGNKGDTYMYGKPIEPYKKACHYAIVYDEWDMFSELCPEVVEAARKALDGIPIDTWASRSRRRKLFGPAVVDEIKRIGDYSLTKSNPLYKSIKVKKVCSDGSCHAGIEPIITDNFGMYTTIQSL